MKQKHIKKEILKRFKVYGVRYFKEDLITEITARDDEEAEEMAYLYFEKSSNPNFTLEKIEVYQTKEL